MGFAGLVMAGGRGLRLGVSIEKPLLKICGVSMLERVVGALSSSKFVERVFVAVTGYTPSTKARAEELGLAVIETRGLGYVEDLREALEALWVTHSCRDVVVANVDLPLLSSEVVDEVAEFYLKSGAEAVTVVVKYDDYVKLGFKADYPFKHGGTVVAPVGLNVLRADIARSGRELREAIYVYPQVKPLVNVNTLKEAEIAEMLICKHPRRPPH